MTILIEIYEQGHLIASHYILQKQQSKYEHSSVTSLAVHNIGLITINRRLGPTKLETQLPLDKTH